MFKTPSKGKSSTKAPFTPRKKGLFEDGQWLCDCNPRRPALCLQVKKEGPNKGKHFYTCDKRKCNFFLFEHDAQVRERDALVRHNCRSENGIVTRVQAKGEPPATPSFGRGMTTTTTTGMVGVAPWSAPPSRQQRIFRGLPRRNSLSQDSDCRSYDSNDEDAQNSRSLVGNHNHTEGATPSPSQTLRHSSGSENPGGAPPAPAAAAGTRRSGVPDPTGQPTTPGGAKRKRAVFLEDSDEEFGGDDLDDPDTERQLAALTDDSARGQGRFGTPSAAQRTVGTGRADGGLPTPVTRDSLLVAAAAGGTASRSAKRLRFASPEATIPVGDEGGDEGRSQERGHLFVGDVNTPTPYRKTNALALPASGDEDRTTPSAATTRTTSPFFKTLAGGAGAADHPTIADEVMSLLAGQPVSEATRRNVRVAMERHELRVKGLARGRDVARAALEARDARIAELQARVVSLENARRLDRAQLREFTEGLARLSQQQEE